MVGKVELRNSWERLYIDGHGDAVYVEEKISALFASIDQRTEDEKVPDGSVFGTFAANKAPLDQKGFVDKILPAFFRRKVFDGCLGERLPLDKDNERN